MFGQHPHNSISYCRDRYGNRLSLELQSLEIADISLEPKDRTNKRRVHESSVKLDRRQSAVQDHAHIEIGSAVESSVSTVQSTLRVI